MPVVLQPTRNPATASQYHVSFLLPRLFKVLCEGL